MAARSYMSVPFDWSYNSQWHNVCSHRGYLLAVTLLWRVIPSGLLWLAPTCGSFIFLSRSQSARCESIPEGNLSRRFVAAANVLCNRTLLLCLLADVLSIVWCVEQPVSSLMPHMPRFDSRIRRVRSPQLLKIWVRAVKLECYGAESSKPIRVWSNSKSMLQAL